MMSFLADKLPKKIEKSCIFQATIELLYQESASIETIVVKLSDALGNGYEQPVKTPAQDIPPIMRQLTPGLGKAICYFIKSKDNRFNIGIGYGLINLQSVNFSYETWEVFFTEFKKVYGVIASLTGKKEQAGVRYINVFEKNVLKELNTEINVYSKSILEKPLTLSWQDDEQKRTVKTSLASRAVVNFFDLQNKELKVLNEASVVDIDCVCNDVDALAADLLGSVDDSHKILKKRFFAICKESFIKDILKPVEVLLLERIL